MEYYSLNSEEAKEAMSSSQFLKITNDFAHYMHKEFVEASDGQYAMVIMAADMKFKEDALGSTNIMMGRDAVIVRALSELMKVDRAKDIFRIAWEMSGEVPSEKVDIDELRKHLRANYYAAALVALWSVALIAFAVFGIAGWISTCSNLLLMLFLSFIIWNNVKTTRHKILCAEQERKEVIVARINSFFDKLAATLRGFHSDDEE